MTGINLSVCTSGASGTMAMSVQVTKSLGRYTARQSRIPLVIKPPKMDRYGVNRLQATVRATCASQGILCPEHGSWPKQYASISRTLGDGLCGNETVPSMLTLPCRGTHRCWFAFTTALTLSCIPPFFSFASDRDCCSVLQSSEVPSYVAVAQEALSNPPPVEPGVDTALSPVGSDFREACEATEERGAHRSL